MGNYSQLVNKHMIEEILEGYPNYLFYPLTNTQSKEIFLQYDHLLNEILKVKSGSRKKFRTDHVYEMCIIGYFNGEIAAFRFNNTKKPYIIFQYKNKNYESSIICLKASYKNQLKNSGYSRISESNLVITTLYLDDIEYCREFHFVSSVG